MKLKCTCPITALTAIDEVTCKTIKPKVRAMLIRMQGNAAFVDGTNGAEEAASWDDLFDSVDGTLIVRTPDIASMEISESEFIEGEENYDGAATVDGILPSNFMATFHNLPPAVSKQLAALFCAGSSLEVAFIYNDDTLQMHSEGTPTEHTFFSISPETIGISTPSREGTLNAKFVHTVRFALESDWYDCSAFVAPEADFSFIKDLKQGFSPTP